MYVFDVCTILKTGRKEQEILLFIKENANFSSYKCGYLRSVFIF